MEELSGTGPVDDEPRLARVTYLPGVQAPGSSDPVSVDAVSVDAVPLDHPSRHRPRPTFAAIYDDEPVAEAAPAPVEEVAPPDGPDRDAELHRAENVSMHALTRRGQSRRELERILRSRDLSDDVIDYEVERLERVGLIDDIALAQNLVGVLQERKGLGRTGIAAELTRRLLAPAAIEYALELVDTGDELARARELAVKRAGQLRSYDRATAERRLSGFLARRGYGGSTVRAAVDHALSDRSPATGVRFR